MSAMTKSQKDCVPNHPELRKKKLFLVNKERDNLGRKKTELYSVVDPWWNTRFS
jgi:hypothetical protein